MPSTTATRTSTASADPQGAARPRIGLLGVMQALYDDMLPGITERQAAYAAAVGEALTTHPDVDLVTMTGSVPTGKRIMTAAAANLTPLSLELGGKAPFIVLDDCDMDLAVRSAVTSRYMNCGQVCICNERMLVHERVYDQFMERFVAASRGLTVGDPLSPSTDLGPKVSQRSSESLTLPQGLPPAKSSGSCTWASVPSRSNDQL